ncbi:MAG TPA: YkvA family protein [Pseudolabrys sp.]|jgi:uncharacterized membrane protein YkvA (DUF1232 family)|nr:YkvA family protein [Pseudolabrys sp.]
MTFARTEFWRGNAQETQRLARDFWRKLGRVAARVPFAGDLLAAYYCAFDRTTPLHVKGMLLGAIAYFVLPTDAIPDMLPVIGFTDDAAVLAAALKMVSDHITPGHRQAAQDKLADLARK